MSLSGAKCLNFSKGSDYLFLSTKHLNLDSKHRLAVPSKYRDRIKDSCGGQMVLMPSIPMVDKEAGTVTYQKNLWLYKIDKFEEVAESVLALPENSPAVRQLRDRVLGQAEEVSLDAGGRIVVPAELREYAGIEKNVVLVGVGNKFVLWSENEYADFENSVKQNAPIETLVMMSEIKS